MDILKYPAGRALRGRTTPPAAWPGWELAGKLGTDILLKSGLRYSKGSVPKYFFHRDVCVSLHSGMDSLKNLKEISCGS